MAITAIQLKKPDIVYKANRVPQARNPIYQIPTRKKCDYCDGRSKEYSTLYKLHYHLLKDHEYEYGTRNYVMSLADRLIRGESI